MMGLFLLTFFMVALLFFWLGFLACSFYVERKKKVGGLWDG
jgi:uncharacterized membrane protein